MSNFVIHREHGISKAQAFEITEDWIVSAEKDYKMHCDVVQVQTKGKPPWLSAKWQAELRKRKAKL